MFGESAPAGECGVGGPEVALLHESSGTVFVALADGVHDEPVVLQATVAFVRRVVLEGL